MGVESVSEEISASSQKWTPDGGRDHVFDDDRSEEEKEIFSAKEKSSAALVRPTSGSGADGLGADGKTGRERRGG